MFQPCHRRYAVFALLGCLLLWNAPAMALPALLQDAAACDSTPPSTLPAAMSNAHAHHHGMHHGAMPVPHASAAACITRHTCCSFNREPAQKSNAFSVQDSNHRQAVTRAATALPMARAVAVVSSHPLRERPVLELKADLRI